MAIFRAKEPSGKPKPTLSYYDSGLEMGRWSPKTGDRYCQSCFQLDGGDVHLWFWDGYAEILEGAAIRRISPIRLKREWEREEFPGRHRRCFSR